VGSRIAAEEAGTDEGKAYINAFSRWLKQRPKLAAVNEQNRAAALWCLREQNWPKVRAYLDGLDNGERQTIMLRTVRRRLTAIDDAKAAALRQAQEATKPKPEPTRSASAAPPDRVQEAADRAEVMTLRAEAERLKAAPTGVRRGRRGEGGRNPYWQDRKPPPHPGGLPAGFATGGLL